LETIFRYCLNNFVGKPVCFVITHKVQQTAYRENANGDSFKDYHDAMVGICEKYSIPYYDAFSESGLNGWHVAQSNAFLTANPTGTVDGCHPTVEGYKRYYVPQLIALFERIMPV
jgi:lysophospholipase L1-like esterase